MYLIQQVTSAPLQKQRLILPNGNPIFLTLQYKPQQYGWFIQELLYEAEDFTLKGMRVVVSPNLLYQQKNKLLFGLACFTKTSREPTQAEDFSSGNATLFLLDQAEVAELTRYISGQARP